MRSIRLSFIIIPIVLGMASAGWTATFTVTPVSDNDCADFNCNLQSALNAAAANNENDTINMGNGTFSGPFTYAPTKNFSLTLIGSGSTVIDGKNTNQGISIDTSTFEDTNAHIILKNISFQNGNNQSYSGGGGLHIRTNKSNITIENCVLNKNTARDGGGAYLESVSGNIILKNDTFEGNSALNFEGGGAAIASSSGNITIESNLFVKNSSRFHGGGLTVSSETGNINLLNNIFIANSADVFGGGASLADMPLVGVTPGAITVVNNTFAGNSASSGGGGLSITLDNTASKSNLYNNILWNNTSNYSGDDLIICDDCSGASTAGEVNLYNNDFSDLYSTCQNDAGCAPKTNQGSNKKQNPIFVNITDPDPNHWDVHLTPYSPCIDAGNSTAPNLPSTDFHGDARIFGPAPDLGAYESPYAFSPISPGEGTLGTEMTLKGSGFGKKASKVLLGQTALKVLEWTDDTIRCSIPKAIPAGSYDVIIQPNKASPITFANAFTIVAPEIESVEPASGSINDQITVNGSFYGTKKGKVTLGGKTCKVLSWTMDSTTGEGMVQFTVPKGLTSGAQELKVTNGVGAATVNFTVK